MFEVSVNPVACFKTDIITEVIVEDDKKQMNHR